MSLRPLLVFLMVVMSFVKCSTAFCFTPTCLLQSAESSRHFVGHNGASSSLLATATATSSSSSPSVLCIGDALFDCIANDNVCSIEDMMMLTNAWTAWPGGAPANVATALCKLGTTSAFAGCLGADTDGDAIQNLLEQTGVDVTLLQRTDKYPTRRVMVIRDQVSGDRVFAGFYDGKSADAFADAYFDMTVTLQNEAAEAVIMRAKYLVCSTLSLAFETSRKAVNDIVNRGLAGGARLYVDVNWRDVFWTNHEETVARQTILEFAQRAHIVKLTDEEAHWLLGISASDALAKPELVAQAFPHACAVLVTAGEKGASYSIVGHTGKVEPFHVTVLETTGAGDAFTAGFIHGLLSLNLDIVMFNEQVPCEDQPEVIQNIVRLAAAVGALTCTSEGAIAAQPTFDEVESFLIHGQKVWT